MEDRGRVCWPASLANAEFIQLILSVQEKGGGRRLNQTEGFLPIATCTWPHGYVTVSIDHLLVVHVVVVVDIHIIVSHPHTSIV